jgi:hypothetical protein
MARTGRWERLVYYRKTEIRRVCTGIASLDHYELVTDESGKMRGSAVFDGEAFRKIEGMVWADQGFGQSMPANG